MLTYIRKLGRAYTECTCKIESIYTIHVPEVHIQPMCTTLQSVYQKTKLNPCALLTIHALEDHTQPMYTTYKLYTRRSNSTHVYYLQSVYQKTTLNPCVLLTIHVSEDHTTYVYYMYSMYIHKTTALTATPSMMAGMRQRNPGIQKKNTMVTTKEVTKA